MEVKECSGGWLVVVGEEEKLVAGTLNAASLVIFLRYAMALQRTKLQWETKYVIIYAYPSKLTGD